LARRVVLLPALPSALPLRHPQTFQRPRSPIRRP
jgi:hypothetical protein